MHGPTYRYSKGHQLIPFGFGVSYTKFKYTKLKLARERIKAGESLEIGVEVENAGDRAGDEVVQLYLSDLDASAPVPRRSLTGIKRVFLKPGERKKVSFILSPNQMSLIDQSGKRVIEPGQFLISVGGKQPGFAGGADAKTTEAVSARFAVTGRVTAIP